MNILYTLKIISILYITELFLKINIFKSIYFTLNKYVNNIYQHICNRIIHI